MTPMKRVLRLLLPSGLPWRARGGWAALLDGLSASLGRVRMYLRGAVSESIPGRANESIPEWAEELGVAYAPNTNREVMKQRIRAANAAVGGQSLEYLQRQLTIEFPRADNPDVSRVLIEETGPLSIRINGDVETVDQYARLVGIVGRIFPVHVARTLNVIALSGSSVGRCGVGVCGVMRCGNDQEDGV